MSITTLYDLYNELKHHTSTSATALVSYQRDNRKKGMNTILHLYQDVKYINAISFESLSAAKLREQKEDELSSMADIFKALTKGQCFVSASILIAAIEDADNNIASKYVLERASRDTTRNKYSRAAIAKTAHYYAKGIATGSYRQRLKAGFKAAWSDAKTSVAAGMYRVVTPTHIPMLVQLPRPVEVPIAPTLLPTNEYDILYYNPAHYVPYTEPRYFNSTRNHILRY